MNILVTVVFGLLVFAEFRDLNVPTLLTGTALILAGGWIVANA